jgi:hypothetical protein
VLLQPAKSHSVVKWLRARFSEPRNSGPAVVTRNEQRPAPKPTGK